MIGMGFNKTWQDDFGNCYEISESWLNRRYFKNGLFHREDGPALESVNAAGYYTEWWYNGLLHRTDGPAVQKYHNLREPNAIEYYVNGQELTKDQFNNYKQSFDNILNINYD